MKWRSIGRGFETCPQASIIPLQINLLRQSQKFGLRPAQDKV